MTNEPIKISKGAAYWLDNASKSEANTELGLKLLALEDIPELTDKVKDGIYVLRSELSVRANLNGFDDIVEFAKHLLETKKYEAMTFGK